jgi:hypothetical protein
VSIRVGTHSSGIGLAAASALSHRPLMESACLEDHRSWGRPLKTSLPHNNANRKKKSKRKQAQTSRRKNRR